MPAKEWSAKYKYTHALEIKWRQHFMSTAVHISNVNIEAIFDATAHR